MIAYPNVDYKGNIELTENLLQKRSKKYRAVLGKFTIVKIKIHPP